MILEEFLGSIVGKYSFLFACRYMFSVFANIFVYGVFWAVLHITSADPDTQQIGPSDAPKFQNIVLIGITIGSITTFIFHMFVREIPHSSTGTNFGSFPSALMLRT